MKLSLLLSEENSRALFFLFRTSDNIAEYYTWIEVDGKPLQVYGQQEKENKIYGYIEAQEGKEFTINFADLRTSPPEMSFSTIIEVDGLE